MMCANTNGAVKAVGSLCGARDLLMYDTLTGTNWAADATKDSVVRAARGETALRVLLCNKRKVRRLSEQEQDQGTPLAFLSSTGVTACAQVLLGSDSKLQKLCIQSGSKILLLEVSCKSAIGNLSAAVFGTAC